MYDKERIRLYEVTDPHMYTWTETKAVTDGWVFDTSKRWKRVILKALQSMRVISGPAMYPDPQSEVRYTTHTIDRDGLIDALHDHTDKLKRLVIGDGGVDRIIVGPDVYGELVDKALKNPYVMHHEFRLRQHTGATTIRGHMDYWESVFDIKIQLVPWAKGVLVVPIEK